jgi:parallel beta-helix repeat protein
MKSVNMKITRTVSSIVLMMLILGMSTFALGVSTVHASATIYIRTDGSIDGTDRLERVGTVYTFIGNISDSIIVEKSGITIDGAGYTLRAGTSEIGIDLTGRSTVTVRNVRITQCLDGVRLSESRNINISANILTDNSDDGVDLRESSDYNSIVGNTIVGNHGCGIELWESSYNNIAQNNVSQNGLHGMWIYDNSNHNDIIENSVIENDNDGISFVSSSNYNTVRNNTIEKNHDRGIAAISSNDNSVYYNDFLNNTHQAYTINSVNAWDNGYPSGGNYWSDYNGTDSYSGTYQNVSGSDRIGDTPYTINANNLDRFPQFRVSAGGGFDLTLFAIIIVVVGACIVAATILILQKRKHRVPSAPPQPPPPPPS